MELSRKEQAAIDQLMKCADNWPKSLWLFSANGVMNVMKKDDRGDRAMLINGVVDPTFRVATIDIECEGRSW